jgi:hypothetical protein
VDWWVAYFENDGIFFTFEPSDRELILPAARALTPVSN